jgi:hypothetical protein
MNTLNLNDNIADLKTKSKTSNQTEINLDKEEREEETVDLGNKDDEETDNDKEDDINDEDDVVNDTMNSQGNKLCELFTDEDEDNDNISSNS